MLYKGLCEKEKMLFISILSLPYEFSHFFEIFNRRSRLSMTQRLLKTLWEKEKNAAIQHFPLFQQCLFYRFNHFPNNPLFFFCPQHKSFENTMGKREIARNEQFLLLPQCFSSFLDNFPPLSSNLKLSSANSRFRRV